MGAVYVGAVLVTAQGDQQVEQGGFEGGGIVHGKVALGIVEDAVGRALAVGLVDQQAVDRHLEDVRIVGGGWGAPGLDLHRDELAILLDQVIGLAGEFQVRIVERFFDRAPGARVGKDHPSAGETEAAALSSRDEQQDEGEQQDGKGKVKGGHGNDFNCYYYAFINLNKLPGAEGGEQDEGDQQKDQRQGAGKAGGEHLPPVLAVELGTGGHFGLVGGLDPFLGISPGTRTIYVGADFGSSNGSHGAHILT